MGFLDLDVRNLKPDALGYLSISDDSMKKKQKSTQKKRGLSINRGLDTLLGKVIYAQPKPSVEPETSVTTTQTMQSANDTDEPLLESIDGNVNESDSQDGIKDFDAPLDDTQQAVNASISKDQTTYSSQEQQYQIEQFWQMGLASDTHKVE